MDVLNMSGTRQSISDSDTGTSSPPAVTLSQTSIAFGDQELNVMSSAQLVTLTNSGGSTLTFVGYMTGPNIAEFSKWSTCTGTLAPGASCVIHFYFDPTAAGAATAVASITDNASNSPQTIALSGTGVTDLPAVTLSQTSVAFGNQQVSTTSAAQSVTLTNSGGSTLTFVGYMTGPNIAEFSKWSTCTGTLAPGASCVIHFYFDPTAAGAATAVASITDNAGNSPQTISLSGTGFVPVELSAVSCSAGSETGAATDICTATLTAAAPTGGFTVNLSSSSSSVTVPASVTVAAGATSAAFTATVSAVTTAQTATLTATASGVTATCPIQLNAAVPGLAISPSSVSFGDVDLNSPSTQSVVLTSSGTAALTISAASITGTGFSMSGVSAPVTLSPGQQATLSVEFDPGSAGAATGAVTLTSNASSGGTATVALTGTGQAPSYEVDLTWEVSTDTSDPVAGYNVYRAVSGNNSYQLMNSSPTGSTSYSDTTVAAGTVYTYYVESVDAEGNTSAPSNTFSATIP